MKVKLPTTAQEVVDKRSQKLEAQKAHEMQGARDAQNLDHLFTVLALYLDHVVKEIQDSVLHTEVLNDPIVHIDSAPSLEGAIARLLAATKENKVVFPKTQGVTGSVEVSNFPAFPEIVIPEVPSQIATDVLSLPTYVGEKLDEVTKAIKAIPAPIVNVPKAPAPQVTVNMSQVIEQLSAINALLTLESLEEEPAPLDLSPLLAGLTEIKSAIVNKPQQRMPRGASGALSVTLVAENAAMPGQYLPIQGGFNDSGNFVLLTNATTGTTTPTPTPVSNGNVVVQGLMTKHYISQGFGMGGTTTTTSTSTNGRVVLQGVGTNRLISQGFGGSSTVSSSTTTAGNPVIQGLKSTKYVSQGY